MATYSAQSKKRLRQCDPRLQQVFRAVLQIADHSILEGHRDREQQTKAYSEGRSKLKWPESKHNKTPALAVDAVPYPVDWQDVKRMCLFAGIVIGVAESQGIKIRWGGDWNGDRQVKDNRFNDLPHFELVD